MSRAPTTLSTDYFDALYAHDADPWRFATSTSEADKYATTLDALPQPRFARALEVGCSIGVLTQRLAPRCDALCAIDASEAAVRQAQARCGDQPWVHVETMAVPEHWPQGSFDLILLSEVVYYFDRRDVAALAARVRETLRPQGTILLVHWTGETDYPLSGDDATEAFLTATEDFAIVSRQQRFENYRLDRLTRR